ncbi:hypothetical protein GQ55_5G494900 [Panicum hallii var. hallii]|jgi:hypothetical protein|uniref:Uncharacterized protein n=3 Tax=Panicum sect. Panicum TaxID=2100772 RepID=A0A3L6R4A5_PANMI|nr:uncharacterized protein LOC112895009 [Panicum hallii]PAN32478.1 hypothetical protein PAHAL_5G489800 [Panicum hallii]PUZ58262.1 hypothetical protein GQ55_5G494900 [Panicum hallii var. hallii]RLM94115.1 uncharacterized protein C2845_PM08G04090 [Panicum miliaceum]
MSARCVKLLLLVTLIPLALRATSLLLGGPAVPASSHHRQSPMSTATATVTGRASVSAGLVPGRPYRQTRRRRRTESALAAFDGTRRLRQADGGSWFEDDKRLAPTGSNPLHNLR